MVELTPEAKAKLAEAKAKLAEARAKIVALLEEIDDVLLRHREARNVAGDILWYIGVDDMGGCLLCQS